MGYCQMEVPPGSLRRLVEVLVIVRVPDWGRLSGAVVAVGAAVTTGAAVGTLPVTIW